MNIIHKKIREYLKELELSEVEFSVPPNPQMGDLAFACFELAKKLKNNPIEVATQVTKTIQQQGHPLISSVQAVGPYVNIFLHDKEVGKIILESIDKSFGTHNTGEGKQYLVEFACPNPLKAFHLGHLKNLITGEAVVRVLKNVGYTVTRVNYQGDVGMHVAKALWGMNDWKDKFIDVSTKSVKERVEFLGKAYAHGAQYFEKGDDEKQEVIFYNDKIYSLYSLVLERDENYESLDERDNEFFKECGFTEDDVILFRLYREARKWSIAYFEEIYKKMNSHFDEYFFESQTYKRGIELVNEYKQEGIFEEGEGGAIIFPGEKFGLHNRVFVNSKGFPTYEAKDLALAEKHFLTYSPDKIIHVVGKEQTEYFKVVIAAIEQIWPNKQGIEHHLPGGFLQLKGDQKMSSRKGNIITGDQLIDQVKQKVYHIMQQQDDFVVDNHVHDRLQKITAASLKYAMLKADVTKDVAFNLEESVSISGDSGPYLLYVYARIQSILKKAQYSRALSTENIPDELQLHEKRVCLLLAQYPQKTATAAELLDPSIIARYLFEVSQAFNSFYSHCLVIQEDKSLQAFRLALIASVAQVLASGLQVLGIEVVDEM